MLQTAGEREGVKLRFLSLVVGFVALLSGCSTTSIGGYDQPTVPHSEAVVLVGVDSEIPLVSANITTCGACIFPRHILGGRKDILAFPVKVGSVFRVDTIYAPYGRSAAVNASELKIDQPGIYYYGTIKGTTEKVGVQRSADLRSLVAVKRKYGAKFDNLEPVNFTWPDADADRQLGIGYQSSAAVQTELRQFSMARLQVTQLALTKSFSEQCRAVGPISQPDFLPYEEYIRRAINEELRLAQIYDSAPGAMALKGAVTELSFNSNLAANWTIGVRLETPDGRAATAKVVAPFESALFARLACDNVEDAWPGAVQKLIEALVVSPEFRRLMVRMDATAVVK
jgi:hypothetical protein